MLIIGITDIHGVEGGSDYFAEADLLIIAGDITHFGGRNDARSVLDGLLPPGIPAMAVPGNCDGNEVSACLEERDISVDGVVQRYDGFPIYGIGGALPGPASTPRELTEEEFEKRLKIFEEEGLEGGIMVSHQPPFKTKLDKAMGFRHVGSRAVRQCIERTRPVLCLTGHIHESSGIDRIGDTLIVNPGPFRHGNYARCRIEKGEVSCTIERV